MNTGLRAAIGSLALPVREERYDARSYPIRGSKTRGKHSLLRRVCEFLPVALLALSAGEAATNASGTGEWISVGLPTYVNAGTEGHFYLVGNDHGTCGGQAVTYFRFDMNGVKWKEVYALLLSAATAQKYVTCVVDTGCGTSEVWAKYCRVSFL